MNNTTLQEGWDFSPVDPIVYGVLSVGTLASSSAVLTLFWLTRSLRSISGWLMVVITLTDTTTSLSILMPNVYTTSVQHVPWQGTIFCDVQAYLLMFLQNFKAIIISLCALERAFSVIFPFKYIRTASVALLRKCLLGAAVIALVVPLLVRLSFGCPGTAQNVYPNCWLDTQLIPDRYILMVYWATNVIDIFIPGFIVIVCYGAIFVIVIKQRESMTQNELSAAAPSRTRANSTVATAARGVSMMQHVVACKMLFIVTLLYFLSHIPVILADLSGLAGEEGGSVVLHKLLEYIIFTPTCTNFTVYYFMDRSFKQAANRRICKTKPEGCHNVTLQKEIELDVRA